MSGATPTKPSPSHEIIPISALRGLASEDDIYNGAITIVAEDGRIFTFIKPDRMGTLPDDLIRVIFTRLITTKDLLAFSETCSRMYTISRDLPVYTFTSEPFCSLIFMLNKDIKNAAGQLINASIEEPKESFDIVNSRLRLCNPSAKLQKTQDTFYFTIKTCCFQKNSKIDCRKLFKYYITALNFVKKTYRSYCPTEHYNEIVLRRISCVFLKLRDKVFIDIINISSDQLNVSVTFDSFKSSAAQIIGLFPKGAVVKIEGSLRNSLRAKYGTAFQAYASQCLGAFPTSTIVADMQQQLKAPLLAEKAAIEAEIAILCGPNKFNGTINDAYMEMEALMNMQDAPEILESLSNTANRLIRSLGGTRLGPKTPIEIIHLTNLDLPKRDASKIICMEQAILRTELERTSIPKKIAAKAKFDELVARLKTLAQWEEGTGFLIGGRLFEVCNQLEDIGFIALFKVRKHGEFCAEMACAITEENMQERYDALLKFSNSQPSTP